MIKMQSSVMQKYHRDVLRLADYVLCLPCPWYSKTSVEMLEKMNGIVAQMRCYPEVDYQPLRLLNMCKAAVAVHYCGLETVIYCWIN